MLHDTKMHLVVLGLVALCALLGCSEKPPVRAAYVPADCPTVAPEQPEEGVVLEAVPEDEEEEESAEEADDELVVSLNGEPVEEAAEAAPAEEVTIEEAEVIVAVGPVDLNTASITELMALPGVGPALARRIADYRAKRPFERPADVRRVKGIGPAKYAKMEPMLRVK